MADLDRVVPGKRVEFLSDDELDALRPMEEAVEGLLDQTIGLSQFVEDLEENVLAFDFPAPRPSAWPAAGASGVVPAVVPVAAASDPPKAAPEAPAPTKPTGQPDDAELRTIARFAPRIDASLLRNCIELLALFAILAAIEFSIYDGVVGSYGVHPHPYWIVILPISASRGVVAGLMAVVYATMLFAVGAMDSLACQNVTELLSYEIMQEPLRFAFVAFFIGQFRDEFAGRYRALWRRFMHLNEAAEIILRHNAVLAQANDTYKTRLLDHSAQFGNLIENQRRLESASTRDIFELALEMVEEHCSTSVCSILLVGGPGEFEMAANIGWNENFLQQRLAESADSMIVREAAENGTRINGLDSGQFMLGVGPLMVAPLFDESKQVCALLCLDQLPADRFAQTTASIFFSIADWAQAGLVRAANQSRPAADPETIQAQRQPWLGQPSDFGVHVLIEDARCTRLGLVASVLGLQATSLFGSGRDQFESLDKHILASLGASVRDTDSVMRFGYPGCYAILLAGTPKEGAMVLRERITKWLEYTSDEELGEFDVTVFHPDEEAPDLRSLLQRMAGHFRKQSPVPLAGACPVVVPESAPMGNLLEFSRRMRTEMGLAMRHRYELYVLYLRIDASENMQLGAFPGHVERYVQQNLRATDGVYQIQPDRYVVVLPGATSAFACAMSMVAALRPFLPPEDQEKLGSQVFAAHGGGSQMDHLLRMLTAIETDAGMGEEWISG